MDIAEHTEVSQLADLVRSRARAEATEWSQLVTVHDAETARIEASGSSLERMIERAGLVLSIGQAMGLSETQVHSRLAVAERVRERAPQTWLAFQAGRIDAAPQRSRSAWCVRPRHSAVMTHAPSPSGWPTSSPPG